MNAGIERERDQHRHLQTLSYAIKCHHVVKGKRKNGGGTRIEGTRGSNKCLEQPFYTRD